MHNRQAVVCVVIITKLMAFSGRGLTIIKAGEFEKQNCQLLYRLMEV